MSSTLIKVSNTLVIVNIQYSSIGYAYPRLFIEEKPGESYLNFDVTVGEVFSMSLENWKDWMDGVETSGNAREILADIVNYDVFEQAIKDIEAGN